MRISLLISKPLFTLTEPLLDALRKSREAQGADWITDKYDAFLLYPGMGPGIYITADGRILWDHADDWKVRGTLKDAILGVNIGIVKTKIAILNSILPIKPASFRDCQTCRSTGMMALPGSPNQLVCGMCAGMGWISDDLPLDESVVATEEWRESTF